MIQCTLTMTVRNYGMHFSEMEFGSSNNNSAFFFFVFLSFYFFSLSERMMREKQQKNKLIFFSCARLSTHVSGLNRRCRRCRRKQKKKKKASYVYYYACILCRARQLGNRNNTPISLFLYVLTSPLSRSFFSFLSLFFTLLYRV